MFRKNDNKPEPIGDRDITGFIGRGMEVEGTLTFEGTAKIEGKFKGKIVSQGTLIVGEGGLVEADIDVENALITGEVKGTVEARTRVELNSPAKVMGDIRSPNLIICEGVTFEGKCNMGDEKPAAAVTHAFTPFTRTEDKEAKEESA